MSVSAWGAALRLARRDVSRNKARSALVVALIGIPVLLIGVIDIGYHTYQLTPSETLTRQIGAADAALRWSGSRTVQQGPAGWLGPVALGADQRHAPSTAAVAALLPPGSSLIEERVAADETVFRTRAGLATAPLVGLDYHDPIATGLVTQVTGHAPRTAGEVAITTALAKATGLGIGDVVRAQDPSRRYIVVGTVSDTSNQQDRALYSVPAAVPLASAVAAGVSLTSGADQTGLAWLVRTPRPIGWAAVQRANRAGLLALSPPTYLHPGAAARRTGARLSLRDPPPGDTGTIAVLVLVAGMALLEVVLLAGPAFAVGAKRRRRDLALVTAGGGSPRDVRRIVLAGGVVLGLLAGVLGVLAAVALARLGLPLLRPHVARLPGAFDVRPLELLVLVGIALLTAVLACVVPARAAARTDVVVALSGRPSPAVVRARVPVLAAVLAGIGVVIALVGSRSGGNTAALAILAGTALLEIAIIVCTPTLLVMAARGGRRLPLTARMALRDAGRNRSAATPAVAAVMASVVGATSILIGIASVSDQQRREYVPYLPTLSADLNVIGNPADARAAAAALAGALPTRSVAVLESPQIDCTRRSGRCSLTALDLHDSPSSFGAAPPLLIDADSTADTLFGPRAARARAALRAGRAVVARRSLLHDGEVRLVSAHGSIRHGRGLDARPRVPHDVPATFVPTDGRTALVIVPRSVATSLGVRTTPIAVLARLTRAPTDTEQQAALADLTRLTPDPNLIVETGYHDQYAALSLALVLVAVAIAVLAAVIATGLANVDARPDLVTLAAVGAAPRIRRTLSFARAGTIAAVGSVVGVVAGFLAPAAFVYGSSTEVIALRMVVPWSSVLAVAVVVPLLAAAVAGSCTRGRLPVE